MARGALIGTAGDGLAVTAAILNAAQMRHANEPNANYRFSMQPEARAVVNRLYQQVNAGEWPVPEDPEELARVAFEMDFPDKITKRLFGGFGKKPADSQVFELDFGLAPVADLGKGWAPSAGGYRRLLESDVFALAVEVPSLGARPSAPWPADAVTADWLASRKGAARAAAAVWLLPGPPPLPAKSKPDEDPRPAIPPPAESAARQQLAAPLVQGFLPRTAAALGAGARQLEPFFLWLETKQSQGARRIVRRQLFDVGGVEPEYPYEEARALIARLGAVSA